MSYKNRAVEDGAQIESYLGCTICGKQTLVKTLIQYGARCFSCYGRFLTEGRRSESADKRRDGQKAWAWHLRARELASARLSPTQREMWRSALSHELAMQERDVVDV